MQEKIENTEFKEWFLSKMKVTVNNLPIIAVHCKKYGVMLAASVSK